MKNILPILTILLLTGCTPASSQSVPELISADAFSDVPQSHEQADAIYYLQGEGIIEGYGDGTFKPEAKINRAEFLKIVAESTFNAEYIQDCAVDDMGYPDVAVSEWFAKYVCAGTDAGLVEGYPDGSFQPANNINFVEAAKIVSNSREIPVMFDAEVWYEPYVRNLADRGAIPMQITSFDQEITRGQMSEIIYRLHAGLLNEDSQTYESIAGAMDALDGEADLSMFQGNVDAWADEDYIYINSNGIADHETGDFPNSGNPNSISAQDYSFRITRNPQVASSVTAIKIPGVAVNGVIFDPGTAERWEGNDEWSYEAIQDMIDLGLDDSNAHVQPSGAYHYHGIPEGIVEGEEGLDHSSLVGFAADGFPVYARYGYNQDGMVVELETSWKIKEGSRPSDGPPGEYDGTFTQDFEYLEGMGDLDECNGMFTETPDYPEGTYAYFLTDEFPYIPRCVSGTPDESFASLQNAGGGPPGGGPGMPPPPQL